MSVVITKGKWYRGIANAIRAKSGAAAAYRPSQLAEAVRALAVYGVLARPPAPDYAGASGTVKTDSAYYSAIAAAIREKNGSSETYRPSQLAPAIMAFNTTAPTCSWSVYIGAKYQDFTRLEVAHEEWENVVAACTPADYAFGTTFQLSGLPLGVYGFRLYRGSTVLAEKVFNTADFSAPYHIAFSFEI